MICKIKQVIKIPSIIRSMFDKDSLFFKKIPIKLRIFEKSPQFNLIDYRESLINNSPFQKESPSQSKHPWIDKKESPGVRTDIRYYDYINSPAQGLSLSEHE